MYKAEEGEPKEINMNCDWFRGYYCNDILSLNITISSASGKSITKNFISDVSEHKYLEIRLMIQKIHIGSMTYHRICNPRKQFTWQLHNKHMNIYRNCLQRCIVSHWVIYHNNWRDSGSCPTIQPIKMLRNSWKSTRNMKSVKKQTSDVCT